MVWQASYDFRQLIFSGGGTRCFWHGGFLEETRGPLKLAPACVTGVSGGALTAACYIARRAEKGFRVMSEAFDELDRNVQWHKIDEAEGITPHQRIYGEVVTEIFDREALEAIAEGPEFYVLLAHPPVQGWPKLSTIPLFGAYQADLAIRSTPHMAWPERFGVTKELADARQAARDGNLVELICNAAVIPPVFNVQRWNGQHVIDGGMASKAAIPETDEGATLILLTRRFRNLPQSERRLYVTVSRETPADKIDFTDSGKIRKTWGLGRRDAHRFLEENGLAAAAPA